MLIYRNFYSFDTLKEAVDYFDSMGLAMKDVLIGGAFGGVNPTEDDDPVFLWEPKPHHPKVIP